MALYAAVYEEAKGCGVAPGEKASLVRLCEGLRFQGTVLWSIFADAEARSAEALRRAINQIYLAERFDGMQPQWRASATPQKEVVMTTGKPSPEREEEILRPKKGNGNECPIRGSPPSG